MTLIRLIYDSRYMLRAHTNGQTDGRMLPSTLSSSFANEKKYPSEIEFALVLHVSMSAKKCIEKYTNPARGILTFASKS